MLHHLENHIENMRQKPAHKKKQYALTVSLCFTMIVFGFWFAAKRSGTEVTAIKPAAPVQALTASVGDAFGYVKDMVFGKNKAKYSSDNVEVIPGKI